ncbi:WD40-like Beta Propeller Repeat [Lentzea albidocapillata subsp. violacea]|uniref:WD40-like Beta Propeller Repeat n=1 Tax=Lentzea albidocapillata subsp. violacea TaxID=128104 RepID=A0A1G8TJM8_9PSEU|nr:PD40 domain-containing protein [Lentzea albidocapillata]SDJ41614.1 WD40-like Beta Propeller Repeat [Lentzea albidocapillata subsp. violacea]
MKRTVLGVVLVAAVLAAGGVFVGLRATGARPAEETLDLRGGELLYVDPAGRVRQGGRTGPACQRVDVAAGTLICLRATAVPAQSEIVVYDGAGERLRLPEWGSPSRARVSPSGNVVMWTVFRAGDSYLGGVGTFSTTAGLYDLKSGEHHGSLEDFTLMVDGVEHTADDVNYWGITFTRDDRTFYATATSSGKTWLVRGSLDTKVLTSVRENVECPSLSPDGSRIAYKFRTGDQWRLHVLDLASGRDTPLAEPRHVDDQPQWLDDSYVAYGRDKGIWKVPASGGGSPELVQTDAASPAVAR